MILATTPHPLYSMTHVFNVIEFNSSSPLHSPLMTLPHLSFNPPQLLAVTRIPSPKTHLSISACLLFSLLTGGGDVRTLMHCVCVRERKTTGKKVLCSLILNVGRSMTSLQKKDQRFIGDTFTHTLHTLWYFPRWLHHHFCIFHDCILPHRVT